MSEPEEEYDWDSAPPWDKRHNLVYRDTDDAYLREKSHLHKDDPAVDDEPAAEKLGSNGQETQIACESVLASQSRRGETPVTPSLAGNGIRNPGGRIGGSAPTQIDSDTRRGETPVTPSSADDGLRNPGGRIGGSAPTRIDSDTRRGESPVTPSDDAKKLGSNGQGTQFSCESVLASQSRRGETPVTPSSADDGLRNPGGRIGGSATTRIDSQPGTGETPVTHSDDAKKLGSNGQETQAPCESVIYIEPIGSEIALVTPNDVNQGGQINHPTSETDPSQGQSA